MKKWIVRTVIILLAILLLVGIIPFEKEISYCSTDYEFALDKDGIVESHDVRIEGKYYTSFLLKDHFQGTFYVSGVEGLLEGTEVYFTFDLTECYRPLFHDEFEQPCSSEMALLVFDRNFERLAIMFTTHYEKTEDGVRSGYSDAESNFLVLGADNKEEAMVEYARMLEEKY